MCCQIELITRFGDDGGSPLSSFPIRDVWWTVRTYTPDRWTRCRDFASISRQTFFFRLWLRHLLAVVEQPKRNIFVITLSFTLP
jgi:hypothetical protein